MALISLILEQYQGIFERTSTPASRRRLGPRQEAHRAAPGVNTEREQAYWDEWNEALRRIIQQQRKVQEAGDEDAVPGRKLRQHAAAPQAPRRAGHALHPRPAHAD